jgi:GT2 family glycosyltransferase
VCTREASLTDVPAVSVVVPTRNRAPYLREALKSVLEQEDVKVEAIVVDDASDDETPDLLGSLGDARVRSIRFESNVGMGSARNAALEVARGRWIAFLDDDDLWAPRKLREQLDAAKRNEATWVYCGVLLVTPEGVVIRLKGPPDPAHLLGDLLRTNVIRAGSSTVVVDAERLRAIGGFDESFDFVGDWDLWIRLAVADRAAAVDEPLAAYRRHSSSFSSVGRGRAHGEVERLTEKHKSLSTARGVDLEGEHLLSWLDLERDDARRAEALAHLRAGRRAAAVRVQFEALRATRSWRDLRRLARLIAGESAHRAVAGNKAGESAPTPVPEWLLTYVDPAGSNNRATGTVGSAGATSPREKNALKP